MLSRDAVAEVGSCKMVVGSRQVVLEIDVIVDSLHFTCPGKPGKFHRGLCHLYVTGIAAKCQFHFRRILSINMCEKAIKL